MVCASPSLRAVRTTELSRVEHQIWDAWRRTTDAVNARIESDVLASSGLSAPDFEVLYRLNEIGKGTLAQHEIRRALGWEKSRLSRHLTRMEERGLLLRNGARVGGAGAVGVSITTEGRKALRAAKPLHGEAVRRHFLDTLSRAERTQLIRLLGKLDDES